MGNASPLGRATALTALLAASCPTAAGENALRAPVASRNLAPIYANLGIPVQRDAAGMDAGRWTLDWSLHWASHTVREREGSLRLEFDGETRRQDLRLTAGMGRGVTFSLNVPWVRHSGGQLDSLIDQWHGFWGMPDGPRSTQARDRLRFAYNAPGGFTLNDSTAGLGDVEIEVSMGLRRAAHWNLAGFLHGKLATGEAADFNGSGERGYGAGLRFSSSYCVWASLSCHAQVGVADVGALAYAPDADERALFAGFTLAWALHADLTLLAQLDLHDTIYRTDPLASNGTPVWGTLGLRWAPTADWMLDAQFSEDLQVGAAPDVTFRLGISRRF